MRAGEGPEKSGPAPAAGGRGKRCGRFGRQLGGSSKCGMESRRKDPRPESWRVSQPASTYRFVHGGEITQKVRTTQMPTHGWMGKLHPYHGMLFRPQRDEMPKLVTTRMKRDAE